MIEIVLDTETTGISVAKGHRIVEIGCIELEDQIPTSKTFHCYLNPQRKVSEDAVKIHGYTDEFLSDKKLIIHNADFDLSHLNNELGLIGKSKISKDNVIDTLDLARDKFPGSQISLDALCKRFRIDNSRRIKHTALVDCELLSKVYINLIDQKEPKLNFISEDKKINLNSRNTDYCKKIILPSSDELKKYSEFKKNSFKKQL